MKAVKSALAKAAGTPWVVSLVCVAAFLACWYLLPLMRVDRLCALVSDAAGKKAAAAVFLFVTLSSAFVTMLLQFAFVYKLIEQRFALWVYIVFFFAGLLGMLAILMMIHSHVKTWPPDTTYIKQLRLLAENINNIRAPHMGVYSVFIVTLSMAFGYFLSFVVREKNLLVPIMLCCAIIDVWTVSSGFVHSVINKAPAAIGAVSSSLPAAGMGKFSVISTIGAGDFIFPAMVFACVFRFGFAGRKNFWMIFAFLYAGMLLILTGLLPYLPALVPVCLAVLLANFREFSLSRREWGYMAIVFLCLAAALFAVRKIHL
ncbi:MAG: hypothetical protein IK083_01465 [Abditibacteriota bacterium]|nr:hypothetical protein [Abditibacteriota bacterium]